MIRIMPNSGVLEKPQILGSFFLTRIVVLRTYLPYFFLSWWVLSYFLSLFIFLIYLFMSITNMNINVTNGCRQWIGAAGIPYFK